MKQLYLKLCRLCSETIGTSFHISYSTKDDLHSITFCNLRSHKISDEDIDNLLKKAIDFIIDNREYNEQPKYTLKR